MNRMLRWAAPLAVVSLLGACAIRPVAPDVASGSAAPSAGAAYAQVGQVVRIDHVHARNNTTGAGALAGGLAGAAFGRQFGSSSDGKAMGTFLGAIAGIFIGNEIEKDQTGRQGVVRISVALDDGSQRSFDYRDAGDLRVGDRVRVEGGRLHPL